MSVVVHSRRFGRTTATSGLPRMNGHSQDRRAYLKGAIRRARFARFKMKEAGGGQLKSLRSFLRISLRSSAYSSTIRRASCVREGLLGGSDPEVGLSSCGISERTFEVCSTLAHRQQRGTLLFVVDLHQGMFVRGQKAKFSRRAYVFRFAHSTGHHPAARSAAEPTTRVTSRSLDSTGCGCVMSLFRGRLD
jgi:hypothetical protein